MHEKKVIILVADHAFFRYYFAISLEEGGLNVQQASGEKTHSGKITFK
jgi:hypothetical protein